MILFLGLLTTSLVLSFTAVYFVYQEEKHRRKALTSLRDLGAALQRQDTNLELLVDFSLHAPRPTELVVGSLSA